MRVQRLEGALKRLHHLDGLDVVYRVNGDGSLCRTISRDIMRLVLRVLAVRVLLRLLASLVVAASLGRPVGGSSQAHWSSLRACHFLQARSDVCWHSRERKTIGQVFPHLHEAEGGALLFSLLDDAHVLLPVDFSPLRSAQVMETPREDDVEGVDQSVRGWRELHGRQVGGRLCEEYRVAGQSFLSHSLVAGSTQAHLLPATSAKGCQRFGGPRGRADMHPLSANPVVIGTSIDGHLRMLGPDVDETFPARPCDASLVADSCAARPLVCRLSSAARSIARVRCHRNTSDVQQPPPIWMLRVLHAGCVQLGSWYERPTQGVPLDLEQCIHGFRRLQVVDVAVLDKIWLSGGFL